MFALSTAFLGTCSIIPELKDIAGLEACWVELKYSKFGIQTMLIVNNCKNKSRIPPEQVESAMFKVFQSKVIAVQEN